MAHANLAAAKSQKKNLLFACCIQLQMAELESPEETLAALATQILPSRELF
jgi:hypothetical protein